MATGRHAFEGFLPRKGSGRAARLTELAAERRTTVLYEAPHRLARTLADLTAACGGDRRVVVARELTKLHEEVWRGTLAGALEWASNGVRGEVVVVLEGAPVPAPADEEALEQAVQHRLDAGDTARDAAAHVAAALGVARRRAYDVAIRLRT
jgi:16S rRNA (cytidine1402-2'-O)-methyltransferase